MVISKEQQNKIYQWKMLVIELAEAKKAEMTLRKEIGEELFPSPKLGVNTLDLGHDYKLKYTPKVSVKVDEAALSALELPEGALDKAILWSAKLSTSGYKGLSDKHAKLLDEALITKPASPDLKFIEPKEKK